MVVSTSLSFELCLEVFEAGVTGWMPSRFCRLSIFFFFYCVVLACGFYEVLDRYEVMTACYGVFV